MSPESDLAAELRLTIRAYRDLVAEGVRFTNQLHSCLGDYYPSALGLFSDLDAPISLAFLVAFPTPDAARAAGRDGIVGWLKEQGYAHPRRAEQVAERATAKGLTAGGGVVRARSRQMLGVVAALQAVLAAKQAHVKALEELLGQHPGARMRALRPLPGLAGRRRGHGCGAAGGDGRGPGRAAQCPGASIGRWDRPGDDPERQVPTGDAPARLQSSPQRGAHPVRAL